MTSPARLVCPACPCGQNSIHCPIKWTMEANARWSGRGTDRASCRVLFRNFSPVSPVCVCGSHPGTLADECISPSSPSRPPADLAPLYSTVQILEAAKWMAPHTSIAPVGLSFSSQMVTKWPAQRLPETGDLPGPVRVQLLPCAGPLSVCRHRDRSAPMR